MRERILKFIEISGLTAAKFADDIGVQRSSVSHILSGRNNPSFDFIQKILLKYKQLNAEWLLLGFGEIYKDGRDNRQPDLFENSKAELKITTPIKGSNEILNSDSVKLDQNSTEIIDIQNDIIDKLPIIEPSKSIEKIIVFYNDKTFSLYTPEK